jgi:hypothetical protein
MESQKVGQYGHFRGKPLEECTREELYECINSVYQWYEDERLTHQKTLTLLRMFGKNSVGSSL